MRLATKVRRPIRQVAALVVVVDKTASRVRVWQRAFGEPWYADERPMDLLHLS
jgi:hypothetical protein